MQTHRHTQTLTDSVIVGVHAVVFVITPHSQPFISSHLRHYSQYFHQRKKWACECYNIIKRLWHIWQVFLLLLGCWARVNVHTQKHTRTQEGKTRDSFVPHQPQWVCQITTFLDDQFPVFWTVSLTHINTKVYTHTQACIFSHTHHDTRCTKYSHELMFWNQFIFMMTFMPFESFIIGPLCKINHFNERFKMCFYCHWKLRYLHILCF